MRRFADAVILSSSLLVASCVTNSSVSVVGAASVSAGNNGAGAVVSEPSGIDCTMTAGTLSGSCSASFAAHTVVTLTETVVVGSTFAGWVNFASGADFDYEQTLGGFQAQGIVTTNPLPLDVDSDRALVVLASFVTP